MREQVVTLAEVTADTLGAIIDLDVAPPRRGPESGTEGIFAYRL